MPRWTPGAAGRRRARCGAERRRGSPARARHGAVVEAAGAGRPVGRVVDGPAVLRDPGHDRLHVAALTRGPRPGRRPRSETGTSARGRALRLGPGAEPAGAPEAAAPSAAGQHVPQLARADELLELADPPRGGAA